MTRLTATLLLMTLSAPTALAQPGPLAPPVAAREPRVDTLHGDVRTDDYHWLRQKGHPAVVRHLEAENAYTDQEMAHTTALQEQLYQEMLGRIKETDLSVPVRRGEYFYYSRTERGKSYPIFCRKRGSLEAAEEVIFDENEAAAGREFFELGGFEVSPDHRYLAILADENGYEDFELRVRDLRDGRWLDDRIPALGFGLAWAADSRTVFYATTDSAKRNDRVWRHRLGTAREADAAVYHEPDVLFNLNLRASRSGEWIFLESESFTSTEVRLVDARRPDEPARVVAPRAPDVEYSMDHAGDRFFIVTNAGGRTNFAIMEAPVADPSPARWTPWVPYREEVFVEGAYAFRHHLVVSEREGGLRRLRIHDLRTRRVRDVPFPEAAYGVFPGQNPEFDAPAFRYTYSSLVTSPSVFDVQLATGAPELRKQTEVPGGFDPSRYRVERFFATARDGTPVPVSLVYRAPLPRDGSRPLLLYAYGSYGATTEPTFNGNVFSLVDRGFIYAIAHVRGGQEMGRRWYDDGKMLRKMNTFTDFIDVAEHLVRARYTSPDRLAANGGSAGGLLMGVITNLRPDLFAVVVADVPFVDVINTMADASIPLTAQEWKQWGNPAVEAEYRYMLQYSPYDNVERKAYPNLLVTSGVNDSRVAYWEPTKWVAKLRALKTDRNALLLKMNMGAGHGGSSGRYERLREIAFRYAFIADRIRVGVVP